MTDRKRILVLLCAYAVMPLASCATQSTTESASTSPASSAAGFLQSIRTGFNRLFAGGGDMYGANSITAPEPDPKRKISVQDCTKPVTQDGGNLVCK
jgi:hypothetical protein